MPAGYSKTPLVKKLGLKPGDNILVVNPPDDYEQLLDGLPNGVRAAEAGQPLDFIHLFSTSRADLEAEFPRLKAQLASDGMLWVSWPKKASKVETDLSDGVVREVGLQQGLVDIKVAAIDATWSGLKFVYRRKDR